MNESSGASSVRSPNTGARPAGNEFPSIKGSRFREHCTGNDTGAQPVRPTEGADDTTKALAVGEEEKPASERSTRRFRGKVLTEAEQREWDEALEEAFSPTSATERPSAGTSGSIKPAAGGAPRLPREAGEEVPEEELTEMEKKALFEDDWQSDLNEAQRRRLLVEPYTAEPSM